MWNWPKREGSSAIAAILTHIWSGPTPSQSWQATFVEQLLDLHMG